MDSGRGAATEGHERCWEELGRDRKGDKNNDDGILEPLTNASKTFPDRTEGAVKKHFYKVQRSGTVVLHKTNGNPGNALCRLQGG